jgi:oxygen-independent coproporphyrinogen-3 oxidase
VSDLSGPGLYVHFPFCSSICPYCDFSVLTETRAWRREYHRCLLTEIDLLAGRGWPDFVEPAPRAPFDTLYFGGGTPSRLADEDLERIIEALCRRLPLRPDPWIFLEANPEDIRRDRLAVWRRLGVRTLSIGAQSFSSRNLDFLGRGHTPEIARHSLELARGAGFHTVACDLIYGLPGQSATDWQRDLEAAISLVPDHLSCYQLTVHGATPFGFRKARGQLQELPADEQASLFLLTHQFLSDHGYQGYEVSNFASGSRHRSAHNRKYWNHTPYLGLGPSANSFADATRWWSHRKIKPWTTDLSSNRLPVAGREHLDRQALLLEYLMLGLRTHAGVDFERLPGDAGQELWRLNAATIERLAEDRLVDLEGRRLRPTLAGLAVADALARSFRLGLG